ncbi:MAG TPA: transcriptional regulator [Rectinemataceae bacterium]|nr:transcriptional regulator [Rectinemataceae bacterium]
MNASAIAGLGLDRVIHERARLVILSYLAASNDREVPFTELRDELGMTAGNLSIQLKVLTDAGFVRIDKRYKDRRPFTGATLTAEGSLALSAYLREIEALIGSIRGGLKQPSEGGATSEGGEDGGSAALEDS